MPDGNKPTSRRAKNSSCLAEAEAMTRGACEDAFDTGRAVAEMIDEARGVVAGMGAFEEIARQASLLSLRASIEAARVEPSGREFAVLANGLSDLAERSRRKAREIGRISARSMEAAQRAVSFLARAVPRMRGAAELMLEASRRRLCG